MRNNQRPAFPRPLLRFWTRQILPMWCFIAVIIFLMQIVVCGIVHDNEKVKVFLQMIEMLPGFVKTLLGGSALHAGNIVALIAIGYQHPLVMLLYMLYGVGVPTRLLAGEVQSGTMELILSRHTTKTQVYTCAALITVIGMFLLVLVMFLGTVTATRIYTFSQAVPLYGFFKTAILGGLLASAIGGIALMAAASFRRSRAVGLTSAFLIVSYFVDLAAEWWPVMSEAKPATVFHYVSGNKLFNQTQWPWADTAVLVAVLAVTTIIGAVIWQRRDLPL